MKKLAVALVAVGSTMLSNARDAHALGAEVGADVGYGLKPFGSSPPDNPYGYPANPFGFGLGLHGGVEISSWYLGASFRYHFGVASDVGGGVIAGGGVVNPIHTSIHTFEVGGELGYQVSVGPLTIRPYLWGGPMFYSITVDSLDAKSSTHIAFAPAAHAHVKLGSPFFLGADIRYNLIFASGGDNLDFATQLSLMGSLGVAF
jgi:hypothetical protein